MKSPTSDYNASIFMGDETFIRRYQTKYAKLFRSGEVVLDLGCGTGTFLELLRERGVTPAGVDSFPPSIAVCKKKGLNVAKDDVHRYLRRTKSTFDGIMCSHIVEHFSTDDVFRLLAGAYRVLRQDGRLIIITPNFANLHVATENFWLDVTHVRPYPISLLRQMLEHTGFGILSSGFDADTGETKIDWRHPRGSLRFLLNKLRWGKYYGNGDSFIVAAKP